MTIDQRMKGDARKPGVHRATLTRAPAPAALRAQIRQIFRQQAGSKGRRRRAVHPDAGRGCEESIHSLGEQPENQAAENIAGTRGGEARRRVGIDDGAAIGSRDDGVRSFQHDDRAALPRGGAGAG